MSAAPPSYEPQRRRALRFAVGATAAFALTQVVAWPINFLAVAVTIALLQQARPMPLAKGFMTMLVAAGSIWAGFFLSLALLAFPPVLVLTLSLVIFLVYRAILSTEMNEIILFTLLIATTIIPVLTNLLPELAYVAAHSLTISFFVGWLFATFAFTLIPAPEQTPPTHRTGNPGEVNVMAINMSLVAGTMLVIFLSFSRTDVLTMLYTALFPLSLSTTGAHAMGLSYLKATLFYGGIATLLVFEILVMAPFLPLAIVLFFAVIYLFGLNTFSHKPTAAEWATGSFAFTILLSGLLASEKVSASVNVLDRLVQIGIAAVFVTFAFAVLEYFRQVWQTRWAGQSLE